MKRWLRRLLGVQDVAWVRRDAMSQDEMDAVLSQAPTMRLYAAINELLDDAVLQATEQSLSRNLPAEAIGFARGEACGLAAFKAHLAQRVFEARQRTAETGADDAA
jgi:hypothetical protein